MKLVIDVKKDYVPLDGDMFVYNKKLDVWECKQKSYIFKEQDKKLKEMGDRIDKLMLDVSNYEVRIRELVNTLAKAVKENMR